MRVLVGNRFGVVLAELTPDIAPVSWILNGIGRAGLTLAKSDSKATEDILNVGNRVYITFDNGLPPWGGTIELPQRWDKSSVSVTCYEIGHLLKRRITRKNDAFYGRPAGAIFYDLLRREEDKDPLGIVPGSIWVGGRVHSPRYHYKSLWSMFSDSLRKMEQCDFLFTPYLESNVIKFRADFYQVAGEDKQASVALVEGQNVGEELVLEEQGDVVNVHVAIGAGSTWGDERHVIVARDSASVARYGLRAASVVYSGVSEDATLEMHARNALSDSSEPRRIFTLPVANHEPGLFSAYDLGDTVRAVLPTFGFGGYDGALRILAREFDPGNGGCKLVVEEDNEPDTWIYQDEPGEAE